VGISAETGMQIVILRIPLIYVPGVGANFLQLLQTVNKGWLLPLRGIANRRSLLYIGNLVDVIRVVLKHPDAANKLYLLSDGQDVSTSQLVELISKALNNPRVCLQCHKAKFALLRVCWENPAQWTISLALCIWTVPSFDKILVGCRLSLCKMD
jgi:nucleoside-diphosphate-sugar epimerase